MTAASDKDIETNKIADSKSAIFIFTRFLPNADSRREQALAAKSIS